MNAVLEGLKNLISEVGWNDIIDIAIMSYIFYKLLVFIRDSRAQTVFKGIMVILGAYAIAYLLKLQMVSYIVDLIIRNAAIILVLVFQPEIRSMLEKMGRSRLQVSSLFGRDDDQKRRSETLNTISNVVESTRVLQKQCMGALIVFERETKLSDIISTGTIVDAAPNVSVFANIFYNKAPLHDGAVVMRANRICAAGCILPLTQNTNVNPDMGTRHRAAIGMSENSDAVVVVVSEESGRISVACNGKMSSSFDPADLSSSLMELLLPPSAEEEREKRAALLQKGEKLFGFMNKKEDTDK